MTKEQISEAVALLTLMEKLSPEELEETKEAITQSEGKVICSQQARSRT